MPISRLCITDFRNLLSVTINPSIRFNFIEGNNGSGKTSLLEAVSTLSTGRSFRSSKHSHVIRHESEGFWVFAELQQAGESYRLGFARDRRGGLQIRLNDRTVRSAAELAQNLPLQVINSRAFQLLEGGPVERRSFLDWMVFHVKHGFKSVWAEYSRCLKHRNSLLRNKARSGAIGFEDIDVWDAALSALAFQIDQMRSAVIALFLEELTQYLQVIGFSEPSDLGVEYDRGWQGTCQLMDQLRATKDRDLKLGFTGSGPHKAEIKLRIRHQDAAEILSRGQLKTLISAMYMAQLCVFKGGNDRDCLLLVDDLPSELDQENQHLLCGWIAAQKRTQVFITGIDLTKIISTWPHPLTADNCKLFHVKQGLVTEQPCDWSNP